jgi:hypothetical protein
MCRRNKKLPKLRVCEETLEPQIYRLILNELSIGYFFVLLKLKKAPEEVLQTLSLVK